ncbi:MAG: outer membrane lipoprotein-sorting protein [Pseudomonadales bacterium]|nr:outer membrane lipoprotein-sorting protein [Pseudomonadales bacterium]
MVKKLIVGILALILVAPVFAETAEEKGLRIAQEGEHLDDGWVDSTSKMEMILINKNGKETVRKMHSSATEGSNDDGKMLMVFDSPRDQKGTALLTHSHPDKDNEQWLYLPALKKVKKIASKSKSGPFLGSEFSFEDIGGGKIEDYDYKWLRDEEFNGRKVWVMEAYPKDKYSGYTKVVSWTDQEDHRIYKAEFWDRKKSHLKTMTLTGYEKYLDKFWRPGELHMVNHQTRKETKMQISDNVFNQGLKDKDFTKNSLKRAR